MSAATLWSEEITTHPLFQGMELGHLEARAPIEPTSALMLNEACLLVAAERDREFGFELIKRVSQILIRCLESSRARLIEVQTDRISRQ